MHTLSLSELFNTSNKISAGCSPVCRSMGTPTRIPIPLEAGLAYQLLMMHEGTGDNDSSFGYSSYIAVKPLILTRACHCQVMYKNVMAEIM